MLLAPDASDYTSKYGLMALQFWLHSRTATQWQVSASAESEQTLQATNLLLSFLVDAKKKKSQKQAIKSVCLMLRNKNVDKQFIFTKAI